MNASETLVKHITVTLKQYWEGEGETHDFGDKKRNGVYFFLFVVDGMDFRMFGQGYLTGKRLVAPLTDVQGQFVKDSGRKVFDDRTFVATGNVFGNGFLAQHGRETYLAQPPGSKFVDAIVEPDHRNGTIRFGPSPVSPAIAGHRLLKRRN